MITPRATRLVRVPDLRAMQRAVIELAGVESVGTAGPVAVIVPTRSAAAEIRRTIENVVLLEKARTAVLFPDLVTRGDFYARLRDRLPGVPPLLTGFEREVLFRLAARAAEHAGAPAPFTLRPGLIVEILRFYDELRRNLRTVDHFHRLTSGELAAVADSDHGAERLLRQAEFLAAAFAEFERRIAGTGRIDEHGLRVLLLDNNGAPPAYEHVIVTVADQAASSHGLWSADFDLLARIPGIRRVDVVATERVLASGFHERLHERHLPGLEEIRMGEGGPLPVIIAPAPLDTEMPAPVYTCRDREEELVEIARSLKRHEATPALERTAVVFQRPLPYLYLARHVFGGAHIPYQAQDALPLAAEPLVAGLDVVLSFIAAEGTRSATVELLGSPQWSFVDPATGQTIERGHVRALDTFFRDQKYLGGWERLAALAGAPADDGGSRRRTAREGAEPALRAAVAAAEELRSATVGPRASTQLDALRRFAASHERLPHVCDPWHARHVRARAAVLAGLEGLREAHHRHDDELVPFVELAAAIRRWIEGQTFSPRTGTGGLLLLDATAAEYADVDNLRVVGLVDGDWPEPSTKSIFFPSKLLEPLGWPSRNDRNSSARARFHDLLRLPSQTVSLSTFSLEDDALVGPSTFLDEVDAAGLLVRHEAADGRARIFDHEALALDPMDPTGASGETARWLSFRRLLAPADAPRFHGAVGARKPVVYAISRVERYLECPFKYFASHVLLLDEERDEESGLTPQERGQFLHTVFETFFREWNTAGRGAITADALEDALALFQQVADAHLARLPEADRALERTYLLGSAVAPGLAERAFAFEIEHGVGVVERLLEHVLEGTFVFRGSDGPREVSLKAKADRIDLLEDGTLRIVDYKTGRAPKLARALQLPVYSACAQQQLDGRLGRSWRVARAGYVAFKEKNAFVSIGNNLEKAIADGEQRLVDAITSIEEGSFPPRPEEPWLCSRCGYPMVCRKDYVGDE